MSVESKTKFIYPNGTRVCVTGQRRAASEAMDLYLPEADILKTKMRECAMRTEKLLKQGLPVSKHDAITYQVVQAYDAGTIGQYIDLETGDYVLETSDGRIFPANIFYDLEIGKRFY